MQCLINADRVKLLSVLVQKTPLCSYTYLLCTLLYRSRYGDRRVTLRLMNTDQDSLRRVALVCSKCIKFYSFTHSSFGVSTLPGKSWIFFLKIPLPGKS